MPRARLAAPFALLLACGPQAPMTTGGGTDDQPPATSSESASTTRPDLTTTTTSTSTSQEPEPTSSTTTGVGFVQIPDGGPCYVDPDDYQVRCPECSTWHQDCPPDYKCSPFADDGGDAWNALRCVELTPELRQPGEPCTVEGSLVTGRDDCDRDSMCFYIDPDTLTGTCVPFCDGTADAPECPIGTACLIANDGVLAVCLPTCDPLTASCPQGHVCGPNTWSPEAFVCRPDVSGDGGQAFDDCNNPAACDPGLACAPAELADECDPEAGNCCLPFCDLNAPACPGMTLQCLPYFGEALLLPGLEHLGLCRLPG